MNSSVPTATAFAQFVVVHKTDGLREALAYLLSLTDYRYIGIWRFSGGKANAAVHFDKESPETMHATEVAETATYCCYVRESGQPFKTPNALLDERVSAHPARTTVQTYCGVPLMDSTGVILGTLCHYDLVPRDAEQINLELMLMVSSYLSLGGYVPAYPEFQSTAG